ncbi:MAG TPA: hypothetical protein VGG36_00830 [Rhizomicrobium sp.]|jgi:hypothetical protein
MRTALIIAAAATLTAATASQAQPQAQTVSKTPDCIQTYNIDHTKAPNDKTILFYMRSGAVYQSNLRGVCPGLSINGFSYVSSPAPQLCPNVQTIRVLRTGSVCMMSAFVPYTPPPKPVN